jgi:hypothetical protein
MGAREIQERTNRCSVRGSPGEDCLSRGLSQRDALRLRLTVRDQTQSGGIVGFGARCTGSDTRSEGELSREFTDERDQHSSRSRGYGGVRRRARLTRSIERVRPGTSIDGIEGIVYGYVHDRVHARFMKWVGKWRDAGRGGSFAGVLVRGKDGIACGSKCGRGMRACGVG